MPTGRVFFCKNTGSHFISRLCIQVAKRSAPHNFIQETTIKMLRKALSLTLCIALLLTVAACTV